MVPYQSQNRTYIIILFIFLVVFSCSGRPLWYCLFGIFGRGPKWCHRFCRLRSNGVELLRIEIDPLWRGEHEHAHCPSRIESGLSSNSNVFHPLKPLPTLPVFKFFSAGSQATRVQRYRLSMAVARLHVLLFPS
ncbi:uncharacterized protein F5891DRAFT_254039 [Suillus fuscotomentosus]|uniref:Uncharacterized protein n=1 Tax=Suillus fuscotomentosus TaxID=1912939 RepID=A0AAD4EAF4_9AGAM|nr:uncharacterized protein F5891DRAFT_254039 [Suillus fuscotomentosus]KAG1901399.1 hypothetical protein F5891DRAFT_254039 [Suillus fuscotomentosus]